MNGIEVTLPRDGGKAVIQAQNKGFRRTRAVKIPAFDAPDGGVFLNEEPLPEGWVLILWIPAAADGGVRTRIYGAAEDDVVARALPAFEYNPDTPVVMDAVKIAQSTWKAISRGAAFMAYVTEVA